jgi:2-polyprenyl-3-methyl-5-hydroxy-6-metoxy-1,4-benzoquinol methylase
MKSDSMSFPAAVTKKASETKCRVCSSGNTTFICNTPNGHSATELISTFRCNNCGLVFVGNEFFDEELSIAYGSLDSGEYYDEIAKENREKMASAIVNLRKVADPESKIIDIGTGNGEFLRVLHEAGFAHVSGHEIPGEDLTGVIDLADSVFQDQDYSSIPSSSFDVVTLLDVVEHVRDPQYLIGQCFRILKPGGHIYFHTPVVTRTDRLMHRLARMPVTSKIARTWLRGRTSIFHLQNYSDRSLRLLLEKAGFVLKEVEIKNELSWPVGRYVRIYLVDRFDLPRVAGKLLTPFAYALIATNFFNANKSIVLAKKP